MKIPMWGWQYLAGVYTVTLASFIFDGCHASVGQVARDVQPEVTLICDIAQAQPEPEWVYLVCAGEEAVGNQLVKLPAKEFITVVNSQRAK